MNKTVFWILKSIIGGIIVDLLTSVFTMFSQCGVFDNGYELIFLWVALAVAIFTVLFKSDTIIKTLLSAVLLIFSYTICVFIIGEFEIIPLVENLLGLKSYSSGENASGLMLVLFDIITFVCIVATVGINAIIIVVRKIMNRKSNDISN